MSNGCVPHRKIRVAFLDYIDPEIGGRHILLARLINHFKTETPLIEPVLFINDFSNFKSTFVADDIKTVDPFLGLSPSTFPRTADIHILLSRLFYLLFFYVRFSISFFKALKYEHIDIVHANSMSVFVLSGLLTKLARRKLVFHMHDALLCADAGGNIGPMAQSVLVFFMRHFADKIIAISDCVKTSIASRCRSLQGKLSRVYNGIPLQKVPAPTVRESKEAKAVSFGRVVKEKGFHLGIKAISILRKRFRVDVKYSVIGDGVELDELRILSSNLGVEDLVSFEGFRRNIYYYLDNADIVLIPSIWQEPFGLSVIESWSRSKVVIATSVGAIPEIIEDGINGFLVPVDNAAQAMAEKIFLILNNPGIKDSIEREACKRLFESYTIKRMADQIASLYVLLA